MKERMRNIHLIPEAPFSIIQRQKNKRNYHIVENNNYEILSNNPYNLTIKFNDDRIMEIEQVYGGKNISRVQLWKPDHKTTEFLILTDDLIGFETKDWIQLDEELRRINPPILIDFK